MLPVETTKLENRSAIPVNASILQEPQSLSELSLDKAIEAIEAEVTGYQNAGMTQISSWLD